MKIKLLFLSALFPVLGFAQFTIEGYYGYINDDVNTQNGTSLRLYERVTSAAALDHTSGANQVWNFTQLTPIATSVYYNVAPTTNQTTLYPGTTRVVENNVTANNVTTNSKIFFNVWAFKAVVNNDFSLNYTDTGLIANLSLDYGNTYSESIAGTYMYGDYSGTFSGTISSDVDAWGTLNLNGATWGATSDAVTRVKITQSINLNYPPFGNVGTATFTNHHYYRAGDQFAFFTSANTSIVVGALGINENTTVLEAANPSFLSMSETTKNSIAVAPNPVRDILTIHADDTSVFKAINVTDINGRIVMNVNPSERQINLSQLTNGMYFLRIDTDSGTSTRKIIKQ